MDQDDTAETGPSDEQLRALYERSLPETVAQLLSIEGVKEILVGADSVSALCTVSSLLTVPSLQANTVRIEALVHLVAVESKGHGSFGQANLDTLLNRHLLGTACAQREDPVEDVFVSNIVVRTGNRLLLEGLWESSDFYLQRLYNIILTLPKGDGTSLLTAEVEGALRLIDAVVQRRALPRYTVGGGEPKELLVLPSDSELSGMRRCVEFSTGDLKEIGVSQDQIAPFIFPSDDIDDLRGSAPEHSQLHVRPIVHLRDRYIMALPSSMGHAVRIRILDWMTQHGYGRSFDEHLTTEYIHLLADTPLFGSRVPEQALTATNADDGTILIDALAEVDAGRYCQIVAVVKGLTYHMNSQAPPSAVEIENKIVEARRFARSNKQYAQGLTLIVSCGLGLGTVEALPEGEPDWCVEAVSAPDYVSLMEEDPGEGMLLWKMIDQKSFLLGHGLSEIVNPNGLLNLFAYWKENAFFLLPSSIEIESVPDALLIPTDSLFSIRSHLREGHDIHAELHPDGRYRLVKRKTVESYFPSDAGRPLYASISDVEREVLVGLWTGRSSHWWVQTEQGESGLTRETTYRIWDTFTSWLQAVVPIFESETHLPSLTHFVFILDLDGSSGVEAWADGERAPLASAPLNLLPYGGGIRITLTDEFMSLFNVPDNDAERAIVRTMLYGAYQCLGATPTVEKLDDIVSRVIPDRSARFFHAFQARTFREIIQSTKLPHALVVGKADTANAKVGLAWGLLPTRNATRIDSRKGATELLNHAVDKVFQRMRHQLQRTGRLQLLTFALRMIESIHSSMAQWQATARAVLSVHKDDPSAAIVIAEHLSSCRASTIALRLVAEMAIQEAPFSGVEAGRRDLANLMSDALLVFHLGGASDAIHRQVMAPELAVAANGDILFKSGFYDEVIAPFGSDFGSTEVQRHSAGYERHFQAPDSVPTVAGRLPQAFLNAFVAEFGFSIDQLRAFRDALENHAIASKEAVYLAKESELLQTLQNASCEAAVGRTVLEELSLTYRGGFETTPEGFRDSDWFPWRFGRRLSLISKPIMRLDNSPNPPYLVSPGLLGEGMQVTLSRYFVGDVHPDDARSGEMKRWLSDESGRRSHQFVVDVASALSAIGLNSLLEKELSELVGEKVDARFGDVDVLAWRPNSSSVLAIECKDLKMAKTTTEIAEQLSHFSGQIDRNGEKDDLLRHVDRCRELQRWSSGLARNVKSIGPAPQVECVVCFSGPVAIKYVQSRFPKVRFLLKDEIPDLLGFFGE